MIIVNFSNVEELIFASEDVQKTLPPTFFSYFEQWKLGKRFPFLRQLGKTAILDLLNQLQDEHITLLEEYFGETVIVEKLHYNIVRNFKIPLTDVCVQLCELEEIGYSAIWRDEEYLYISMWR